MRAQSAPDHRWSAPVSRAAPPPRRLPKTPRRRQVVYTGTATDDSLPVIQPQVRWRLPAFAINGSTGAVTLSQPDYETQASYAFTVVATDAQENALSGPSRCNHRYQTSRLRARIRAVNGTSLGADIHRATCNTRTRRIGVFRFRRDDCPADPERTSREWRDGHAHAATTAAYGQTITVSYACPAQT